MQSMLKPMREEEEDTRMLKDLLRRWVHLRRDTRIRDLRMKAQEVARGVLPRLRVEVDFGKSMRPRVGVNKRDNREDGTRKMTRGEG